MPVASQVSYTYMLARTRGGDTFEHECAAEEDGEADWPCGCQNKWPSSCVDGGLANTFRPLG